MFLADHPDSIIMFNLLCSKVVPDTILANGGRAVHVADRTLFLEKKKNQEVKAAFIGELSGHFFLLPGFLQPR